MQAAFFHDIALADADATADLAATLATRLRPGDTILLSGPIGAGKTHFARALIRTRLQAAGRDEDVPSPTFTLVQTYDDGTAEIWHADLYRLGSPGEAVELGLDDAFRDAIVLVEWPDRLGEDAPDNALTITLSATGDGEARRATLSGSDPKWSERLEGILLTQREATHG